MAQLQTFPVAAFGGLDLVSPTQLLSQRPGFGVLLNNMECRPEGGYQRIKGYKRYGDIPDGFGDEEVRGIHYYKGVVVVVGNTILHSPTGATFFPVSVKDCDNTPSIELFNKERILREGTGRVNFVKSRIGNEEVLLITDPVNPPAILKVSGDNYTYKVIDKKVDTDPDLSGFLYCTRYQDHVVIAGGPKRPGEVAISARFNPEDFVGAGSWSFKVQDEIVGVHTFRDYLYVFCKSSIYRVINLESSDKVAVRPVTTKIGCVSGRTIQEIGGDILFLSADGLRYLSATERIDDVNLTTVSGLIRPLIENIDIEYGRISAVTIPSKSQYRLYYRNKLGKFVGIVGTLGTDGNFQWSTMSDMNVVDITSDTEDGVEYIYHVGAPRIGALRVYRHEQGDTFDGTPFTATWRIPYTSMGDGAVRKCMHSMNLYIETKSYANLRVSVNYDHGNPHTLQPEPFYLDKVTEESRYGSVLYGKAFFGATKFPVNTVFLEGSGEWIQFTFDDISALNGEYVIRGFDLQFTSGGRV